MSSFSNSSYKLAPKVTIAHTSTEIFSIRWSPDGHSLLAGCGGTIIAV